MPFCLNAFFYEYLKISILYSKKDAKHKIKEKRGHLLV